MIEFLDQCRDIAIGTAVDDIRQQRGAAFFVEMGEHRFTRGSEMFVPGPTDEQSADPKRLRALDEDSEDHPISLDRREIRGLGGLRRRLVAPPFQVVVDVESLLVRPARRAVR